MSASRGEPRSASLTGLLLGFAWIVVGLGVGWAVGDLIDRLASPVHHGLVEATLGLCALVLLGWCYGTLLLYREVRAGIDAAAHGAARLRSRGWVAAYAAPIIGVWIAVAGSTGGGRFAAPPTAAIAPTRPSATGESAAYVHPALPTETVVVVAGDTLPELAHRFLGSADAWPAIARANAGKLHEPTGSRLIDPSTLPSGLELVVPGGSTTRSAGFVSSALEERSGPSRDRSIYVGLGGFGLLGAAMFAFRQRRRRDLQAMRAAAGDRPPVPDIADATAEHMLRHLDVAGLPAWIDAANRLLFSELCLRPDLLPRTAGMKAGNSGIELLLESPDSRAPNGFLARDGGHRWQLDPRLDLGEVNARAGTASQSLVASLIPVGEDESCSYLVACGPGEMLGISADEETVRRVLASFVVHLRNAPWGEVEIYRLGPTNFPGHQTLPEVSLEHLRTLAETTRRGPLWRRGIADRQPIVIFQDPSLAARARALASPIVALIGPTTDADRVLAFDADMVSIEPLGLRVPALVPDGDEIALSHRLVEVAAAAPRRRHAQRSTSIELDLPIAGAVEIRLLRSLPDLVGDIEHDSASESEDPLGFRDTGVVSLLAYLALHPVPCSIDELRRSFTTFRRSDSYAEQALRAAVDRTRHRLGVGRVPYGWGAHGFELPDSVTCDWNRFASMAEIARACDDAALAERAREARTIALELVGDGPPCDAVRHLLPWISVEQVLGDIEAEIVEVAYALAVSEIAAGTDESIGRAEWAVRCGRRVAPNHAALIEAAMFIADARGDTTALTGEFESAVEAVDRLGLGEEVAPRLESLYAVLRQNRRD